VRVQPFALSLELKELSLPDADGQPMLGFKRLFVDAELASLWRGAIVLREMALDEPAVRAVLRADGRLNLADLVPPADATPAPADSEPPPLQIDALRVSAGTLDYIDSGRTPAPLTRRLAPVNLALNDFRTSATTSAKTSAEGGGFELSARSTAGEQLQWKGRLAIAPAFSSQGEFRLSSLQLPALAELLGDVLPLPPASIRSGTLGLEGRYEMALPAGRAPALKLQLPRIALDDVALRAPGESTDWVTLPSLVVADSSLALAERRVAIGSAVVRGLRVKAWLDGEGGLNLQRLVPARPTAPTAPAAPAPAASAPAWNVQFADMQLTEAHIEFEDRLRPPTKRYLIAPLSLRVQGAGSDLAKPLQVQAEAQLNERARFKASGSVTPAPLAATLQLGLQGAELMWAQPYIQPHADLGIEGGRLSASGTLNLRPTATAAAPALAFVGALQVDGFKSIDRLQGEALASFERLELQGLRVQHGPDALAIDRVLVRRPYARLSISRDRVFNVAAVLSPARSASASTPPASAAPAPAPAASATNTQASEPFPIRIRELRIDEGRLNFADASIEPNFAAEIQALGGTVSGLSSDSRARATVALAGQVDEFAPVRIGGTVQPFAYDHFTDLRLEFKNISLPVFNPYSGRFAGYNISKGKLDTTLHYQLRERKLEAAHKIRIDQLEWGAATPDQGAATLPIRFATSLLKDRRGVIELDVPVSGTLDDPQFRIGPIVWQIIKNLLTKAVTAPFALLGSLFSEAQDAQFVDFAPGDATLDAAAAARLKALAKALADKPELRLDIPIGQIAEVDRPGLAARKTGVAAPGSAAPAATAAPSAQSAAAAAAAPSPAAAASAAAGAAAAITDAELQALARERAAAVQRALLTDTGLAPERVFVTESGKVSAQGGSVRFELGLK
jgi:uncharacterized protein involved in outer membrane biogenesis